MTKTTAWMTVEELAARYRISRRTAYRWAASSKLRTIRTGPTGRGIRIAADDVERLEQQLRQASASA